MISLDQVAILKTFGKVRVNEPLAKYTTFKIGGPVDVLLVVTTVEKAVEALQYLEAEGIPFFLLGGGSNMLVRDAGFSGVALKIAAQAITIEGTKVYADAGCVTAAVADESIKAGLTGFEWGVGVPGTIGGAVRGNAGAVGSEMSGSVESVMVYDRGEVVQYEKSACDFHYRHSVFKTSSAVVLRVTLALQSGSNSDARKKALDYVAFRIRTQPQGFSTGCIFKNVSVEECTKIPEGAPELLPEFKEKGLVSAGWLIEKSGAKGMTEGKAIVSEKHGNFILNSGGATAEEILILIDKVKQNVYDTFGVTLVEEVQII